MLDDYEIIKELSKGHFGKVYLIKRRERLYTAKIVKINEHDIENVYKEAKILSSLSDRYVVHYYEAWSTKSELIIVTEYCPHGDLGHIIRTAKNNGLFLTQTTIIRYLLHLLYALDYVHSRNIIHRDIKPANILISAGNECILTDFGLSKVVEVATTTQVGSPIYCAPEILQGMTYTHNVDIWALGCVLQEMCSLRPPYYAESIPEILDLMRLSSPRIPTFYDARIQELIDKMLTIDSLTRPDVVTILKTPLLLQMSQFETENLNPVPICI